MRSSAADAGDDPSKTLQIIKLIAITTMTTIMKPHTMTERGVVGAVAPIWTTDVNSTRTTTTSELDHNEHDGNEPYRRVGG